MQNEVTFKVAYMPSTNGFPTKMLISSLLLLEYKINWGSQFGSTELLNRKHVVTNTGFELLEKNLLSKT